MMRLCAPALAALIVLSANLGCDAGDINVQPGDVQGMLIQEFPIVNGAIWAYQNVDAPGDQYRISVEGTRNISAENHWKLVYTKLDDNGAPLVGTPPDPIDFYGANGLHLRFGALNRTPGIFARAVFIGGVKAAAVGAFPVANAYIRRTVGTDLEPLDPQEASESREPVRYDEFSAGTIGLLHEGASEVVFGSGLNFQKHLPPRRFWQFPIRVGAQWTVFRTAELSRGPTSAPQPGILAERRVAEETTVSTPGYTGPAYLVEEWVVGLRKDDEGNEIVPSLDDENNDGTPDRGEPTARYWVAAGIGVVQYEYEFVDLGPPAAFTRKTYQLTRYNIPDPATTTLADTKAE